MVVAFTCMHGKLIHWHASMCNYIEWHYGYIIIYVYNKYCKYMLHAKLVQVLSLEIIGDVHYNFNFDGMICSKLIATLLKGLI